MQQKELYLCLLEFDETNKIATLAIATSREMAEKLGIEEAAKDYGEHLTSTTPAVTVFSVRRHRLEQAAREVLGWEPPRQQS
jgi:hypothetical protein